MSNRDTASIYELVSGKKILITGASGQCGRGFVHVPAKNNEVHGVARFLKAEVREEVEKAGCVVWAVDMETGRPDDLPVDFDLVLHLGSSWGKDSTLEE